MTEPVRLGPDNPHPLCGRKTELVWDGKYDEYGLRRPVDVAGSAMPMQKIETVNIPRSEALAGHHAERYSGYRCRFILQAFSSLSGCLFSLHS